MCWTTCRCAWFQSSFRFCLVPLLTGAAGNWLLWNNFMTCIMWHNPGSRTCFPCRCAHSLLVDLVRSSCALTQQLTMSAVEGLNRRSLALSLITTLALEAGRVWVLNCWICVKLVSTSPLCHHSPRRRWNAWMPLAQRHVLSTAPSDDCDFRPGGFNCFSCTLSRRWFSPFNISLPSLLSTLPQTKHLNLIIYFVWTICIDVRFPLLQGICRCMAAVPLPMPTKLWDSAGRHCGRTFLYLHIIYVEAQPKNPHPDPWLFILHHVNPCCFRVGWCNHCLWCTVVVIWIILKFIEVHYNSAAGMDDDDFVSAWSLCMTTVVTWWTDLNVPSSFKFIVDVRVCHRFGHGIPEGDVIHASVTWLFVLCLQCGRDSFHRGRSTAKNVAWISSLHWKEQNETAAPLRAWCESHGYDSSLDAHSLFVLGHGIQNDNQDGKFRLAFACRGHQDSIVCNIDAFCWCACLSKGF